jgi:hypothetical protein
MPDLTLYREDVVRLNGALHLYLRDAHLSSKEREELARLSTLLSDRLSQGLHDHKPASCDVCGRLAQLARANHPSIETYACQECLEHLRLPFDEWHAHLNDRLEEGRGFGTTTAKARYYYAHHDTVEEAAADILRSWTADDQGRHARRAD